MCGFGPGGYSIQVPECPEASDKLETQIRQAVGAEGDDLDEPVALDLGLGFPFWLHPLGRRADDPISVPFGAIPQESPESDKVAAGSSATFTFRLEGESGQDALLTTPRLLAGVRVSDIARIGFVNVTLSGASVDRRVLLKPKQQMLPATQVKLNVQVGGTDPKGGNKVSLVNGAQVSIMQNGRAVASGFTNHNGVFSTQLVPGKYQIQATHGSYYPGNTNVTLSKATVDSRILLRPKVQIK